MPRSRQEGEGYGEMVLFVERSIKLVFRTAENPIFAYVHYSNTAFFAPFQKY